jgi:hypothetical protein
LWLLKEPIRDFRREDARQGTDEFAMAFRRHESNGDSGEKLSITNMGRGLAKTSKTDMGLSAKAN